MPRDRLVKTRDRVLAVSKTLPVPILRPVLLQGWMEDHAGGEQIYP